MFQVKVEINEDEARLVQSWQDRTAFIANVELNFKERLKL